MPVLLEQTPHGKDRIARGSANTAKYFVSRGYNFAVADLRGFGNSQATDPFMQTMISQGTGENAYYNDYWESLNVTRFMPKIVSLGIPVLSETGWYDLFPGANIDAT